MTDLANDQNRRAIQHDDVKAQVEGDINAEIAAQASQPAPAGAHKIEQVAGTFREHAVDEVVDSERAVRRSRGVARLSQVIDYFFFLIYALLAIRFVLSLIAARSTSGFVQFIVSITNPIYAPFKNIVASPSAGDGGTFLVPVLVALAAYAVLHLAINRLLRLIAIRRSDLITCYCCWVNANEAKCLVVSKVLVADGMMADGEREFLADLMQTLGLTDEERHRVVELEGLDEAEAVVTALPIDDRRALVSTLVDASSADGKLSAHEMELVKRLTAVLGL